MLSSSGENPWWDTEDVDDIIEHLLERERRCKPYAMRSTQLSWRPYLIEYLCSVCEKLQLCTSVKHLAAYILDIFMDSYSIVHNHFQLVILGCVAVAAKVDENTVDIPRMSELNALVSNAYKLKEFVNMEIFLMEFFKWDLLLPTASTFTDYYSIYCVLPSDNYGDLPVQSYTEAKTYVMNYVNYFLNISLHEVTFRLYQSSMVAASCIAATRICLHITPSWPQPLQEATRYTLSNLKGCIEVMIRILELERVPLQKQVSDLSLEGNLSPYYGSDDGGASSGCSSNCSTPLKCPMDTS